MWLVLLVACDPSSAPTGGFTSETYAPPWASHLMYRQLDPEDLAAVDTGATLSRIYHVGVTPTGANLELVFSEGDNYATASPFMTWSISAADGLALTAIDGEVLQPAVTLLASAYQLDEAVTSGGYRTTPEKVDLLTTWYGDFEEVMHVRVDGSTIGDLYLAEGVGLVQFTWGDLAGDLAWYE